MKESIGYTVTLDIIFIFIIIVFSFLASTIVYFRTNKTSNIITEIIEKSGGYNYKAVEEITDKLGSIGYSSKDVNCSNIYKKIDKKERNRCVVTDSDGTGGYCVFLCREEYKGECHYYYKTSINMEVNLPIINDILNVPIFANTNRLYDFEDQVTCK